MMVQQLRKAIEDEIVVVSKSRKHPAEQSLFFCALDCRPCGMQCWTINIDSVATHGRVESSTPNSDSKLAAPEFIESPKQVWQNSCVMEDALALVADGNHES